jgi:hypothetical protein
MSTVIVATPLPSIINATTCTVQDERYSVAAEQPNDTQLHIGTVDRERHHTNLSRVKVVMGSVCSVSSSAMLAALQ